MGLCRSFILNGRFLSSLLEIWEELVIPVRFRSQEDIGKLDLLPIRVKTGKQKHRLKH
jgi:hypothetical protein